MFRNNGLHETGLLNFCTLAVVFMILFNKTLLSPSIRSRDFLYINEP